MNGNNNLIRKYQRRERKLRATYRRRMVLIFIIALILGAVGGWYANDYLSDKADNSILPGSDELVTATPEASAEVEWNDPLEATEEPTSEPTEEPTEEPTSEPTEEPTAEPTEEPTSEPTAEPTEEPTAEPTEEPTAEPTEEPTAEPTEEPTPEPTAEPVVGSIELPVAPGESYSFNVEVLADGSPRKDVAETEYFTVPVTLTITRHMGTEYYAATYGKAYILKGNESGCELEIALGDCEGIDEIVMQNVIEVVLQNAAGEIHPGYQFTNAEISGQTDSLIFLGTSATIYKRYNAGEVADLEYMTVSYYENGEKITVYYDLGEPETGAPEATEEPTPAPTAEPTAEPAETTEEAEATPAPSTGESYTIGDKGDGVMQLQSKLIQLGYLSGKPDGHFGQWTAGAIKEAQKDFGMEQTGIADAAFLDVLYTK